MASNQFRCEKCRKLLAKYDRCWGLEIKCPRCGHLNHLTDKCRVEHTDPNSILLQINSP